MVRGSHKFCPGPFFGGAGAPARPLVLGRPFQYKAAPFCRHGRGGGAWGL